MGSRVVNPLDAPVIGLLAGWGRYPVVLAEVLRQQQRRLIGMGVQDHADPELRPLCDQYVELGLGRLGAALRYFRRHGVTTATMAGKIHKVLLFQRYYWWKHRPDWQCIRTFFPHFITQPIRPPGRHVARGTCRGIRQGRNCDGSGHRSPARSSRAPRRSLATAADRAEVRDIEFGWRMAKQIGQLDIGQTVAVKGQAVLAVEAIEGTDECIRRAGQLCGAGGFTVVKVAKPQQDMRFDVPTIGMGTIQTVAAAGGKVLAVEADKTILIDKRSMLQYADDHGIAVVAIEQGLCQLGDDPSQ